MGDIIGLPCDEGEIQTAELVQRIQPRRFFRLSCEACQAVGAEEPSPSGLEPKRESLFEILKDLKRS